MVPGLETEGLGEELLQKNDRSKLMSVWLQKNEIEAIEKCVLTKE